jgi:transmembrane 9 superfamily member 2/4
VQQENTVYAFKFMPTDADIAAKQSSCMPACEVSVSYAQVQALGTLVEEEYRLQLMLSDLPVGRRVLDSESSESFRFKPGFPVGFRESSKTIFYDHYQFTVYIKKSGGYSYIVGFEGEGKSNPPSCRKNGGPVELVTSKPTDQLLTFNMSYSIQFVEDSTFVGFVGNSRWERYYATFSWYLRIPYLVLCALAALTLAGIGAFTLIHTSADIRRYQQQAVPSFQNEPMMRAALSALHAPSEYSGWALLTGDVLRPPRWASALAALATIGLQAFLTALLLLFPTCLGFPSPRFRGSILLFGLLAWVGAGMPAGYVGGCLSVSMKTPSPKSLLMWYSSLVSILPLTGLVLIRLGARVAGGYEMSFSALFFCALLYGTSIVLCNVFLALPPVFDHQFHQISLLNPLLHWTSALKTNAIPRQIPTMKVSGTLAISALLAGMIPFFFISAPVIEFMGANWSQDYFHAYPMLLIGWAFMLFGAQLSGVTLTYTTLSRENYHWWWRSFLGPASSALWIFLAAGLHFSFYIFTPSSLTTVSLYGIMVWIIQALAVSLFFGVMNGAMGLMASFVYVRLIYNTIKSD